MYLFSNHWHLMNGMLAMYCSNEQCNGGQLPTLLHQLLFNYSYIIYDNIIIHRCESKMVLHEPSKL